MNSERQHIDNKEEIVIPGLSKTIARLLKSSGLTLTTLHKKTGITFPTLKRLESDPSANPTIGTLLPIAKFFGITVNQLIGDEPITPYAVNNSKNKYVIMEVPIICWEQIPSWPKVTLSAENPYLLVDTESDKDLFALNVGNNKWSTIQDGSIIIIDKEAPLRHGDFILVGKDNNVPIIRKLIIDEENRYFMPLELGLSAIPETKNHSIYGVIVQIRTNFR